jgi:two-component system, LytTR family, sensor kinase
MKARVVFAVCGIWLLVALVWGSQTALGSVMQGDNPVPFARALTSALVQTVPWIPVTLGIIALTVRFPITRATWPRYTPIHLFAAGVLAFCNNVLVVLGYWTLEGTFHGFGTLMSSSAMWAGLRLHIALLVYGAILGITQAVLYYQATRARELNMAKLEGQLARARLQALNAQIRPHFLFNTMHTIGQLWRSGRSDDADAVLDHLGSLFHKVQSSTSQLEVPLSDELELVKEYLAIEEARFRDRLRTKVSAEPEALELGVPPLILQPLVENAVRHGVSAVSTSGTVEVTAVLKGDTLQLTVRDDGPGMNAVSKQPGSGTGLRNTRERLQQLYGAGGQLSIEPAPRGGTVVTVEIPLSRNGAYAAALHD